MIWRLFLPGLNCNPYHVARNYMPEKRKTSEVKKHKLTKLVNSQLGVCAYCGRAFSDELVPTLDHILPKTQGGKNEQSNLVAACRVCNLMKGDLVSYGQAERRARDFIAFAKLLREKGYLRP